MPIGYYVEADGTVRTAKSIEKDIDENTERQEQAASKTPSKAAVVLCPFCKTPVAQERYRGHVMAHGHGKGKTVKETKGIIEKERSAMRSGRKYRPYGSRRIMQQPGTGLNLGSGSKKASSPANHCPYCGKDFFPENTDTFSRHLEIEREKAITVFLFNHSVRSKDLHESVFSFRESLRNALMFWEGNPAGNSPESAMRFYGGIRNRHTQRKEKKAKPAKPKNLYINACPYCDTYFYREAEYERHLKKETSLITQAKNKYKDELTMYWRKNASFLKEYQDANGCLLPYIEKIIIRTLAKCENKKMDSTPQELLDELISKNVLKQAKNEREEKYKKRLSQRQFLYEYFSNKKPGFKANINDITEQWKVSTGFHGGIKRKEWTYLKIFLAKHGLKPETSKGYITLESTAVIVDNASSLFSRPSDSKPVQPGRKTSASNKESSPKTSRREKVFSSIYTATIADITGRDIGYANKGDYRFRESGRFGSTPLYDDYDN